jgi:8-oxo-dGTP diphosphatase
MRNPNTQYIAVKALIKNDEGKVLVLKQNDPTISGDGRYHPPGGIVELGESVKDCVVREVKEETGLDVEVKELFDFGEWRAERGNDVMQFVGMYFVCEGTSENIQLQESEVACFAWVGSEDIDSLDILEPSKTIIKGFLAV